MFDFPSVAPPVMIAFVMAEVITSLVSTCQTELRVIGLLHPLSVSRPTSGSARLDGGRIDVTEAQTLGSAFPYRPPLETTCLAISSAQYTGDHVSSTPNELTPGHFSDMNFLVTFSGGRIRTKKNIPTSFVTQAFGFRKTSRRNPRPVLEAIAA